MTTSLPPREVLLNLLNHALTRREFEYVKKLIDQMIREAKNEREQEL